MPMLVIISHTLRRDLEEPLRHFRRIKIVHLYHDATYSDMAATDFASKPIHYRDTADMTRLLGELKPDIIQGPEPYASRLALKNAWAVSRYATRTKTPYFFPVFENRPVTTKFGMLVGTVMRWILGVYGRRAVGVVVLNDGARQNVEEAGVEPGRITRLNWGTWGIPTDEFKPKTRAKSTRPTVQFVGRISAKKGLDDVLAAWESILAAIPTAQLVIGGPALDADGQALLVRIKDTPAATYVGPIKNTELPQVLAAAWVTLAPSVTTKIWAEQVGMVALQSLSCGTPVVTTRSGSIPEYVGKNNGAILVDEHDVTALATQAIKILSDPTLRDTLGAKGRAHIETHYEVRQNVRRCEDYVLGLLNN